MSRAAYYSIVQYCPDRFRAESANVGLVLLRPEPPQLRVRMTDDLGRVKRWFGMNDGDVENLKFSVRSMQSRIESIADESCAGDALAAFAATLANDLRLTALRLAVTDDFDAAFDRLYADLVA